MATVHDYVAILWDRQKEIALRLGSDIRTADHRDRVINFSQLVLHAALIKDLIDNGQTTGARLNAVLNTALGETWPEEPDDPRQQL